MSNRCSRIIGILNKLKRLLPLNIKIMLYNTLILSHLNYGLTAWGYRCDRLKKLQKKAVHYILSTTCLRRQVVDTGLSGDILKYLKDPKLHPDRLSAKVVESVVSRFLGILHNVVLVNDASRQIEIVKTEISQVS